MKDILADIRKKLLAGAYQNEEHVRFSLVGRLLQALGWDIWNPAEVSTEFVPVPAEDKKKVDVALLSAPHAPSVFIELKPPGGIFDLAAVEQQLRNYNRDITAPFSIITDGRTWRFYHSLSAGEFSKKQESSLLRGRHRRSSLRSKSRRQFPLFLKGRARSH